ncbi:MAG TPA: hypothetical protein VFC13_11450, partial [Actinomycetes bacterium]|nr:hypothetical protein [Actinomycetes bacterium]
MFVGLLASAAGGVDQGPDYRDRNFSVEGGRSYSGQADRTTFRFRVTGDGPADYFLIHACEPGASLVRAFGPDDQQPVPTGSDEPTGHESLKFEPGRLGSYTIIYRHNIGGAEFVIKNGDGHRHFSVGSGCPAGTEVTTSTRSGATPTTEDRTTTTRKATTTTRDSTTTTDAPTTSTTD